MLRLVHSRPREPGAGPIDVTDRSGDPKLMLGLAKDAPADFVELWRSRLTDYGEHELLEFLDEKDALHHFSIGEWAAIFIGLALRPRHRPLSRDELVQAQASPEGPNSFTRYLGIKKMIEFEVRAQRHLVSAERHEIVVELLRTIFRAHNANTSGIH